MYNMFFSFVDVKARWKSLRSQYRKHLSKQKTKSGQAATKIIKWKFQMSFLNEFLNQDRPRLTSIDKNSDEEEGDSCKENLERDSQEHSEITSFQNNTNTEDYESQSSLTKTMSIHKKKKQKPPNAVQESASTTLMKYLIEKKGQENKAPHPIDDFFP